MSTAQRALLVVFVLAAAGGMGFLLLESGEDPQPAPFGLGGAGTQGAPAGGTPRAADAGPTSPNLRSAARPEEADPEGTSLTVLVVDDDGRPLPQAEIALLGEEGARVTGRGTLEWADATPGTWVLKVESEGLLPFRREVVVEANARTRVTAQLRDHVRLEGRAVDVFDRPVEDQQFWLLGEGQGHPEQGESVKAWPSAISNRLGEFTLRAPRDGAWRVSLGPPGGEVLRSAPLDLHLGGPSKLEVVVGAGGTLQVAMRDASSALEEGRAVLRVAVLKRRKNVPEGGGDAAEQEGRRRREGGRRARDGEAGDTEEAGTPEPAAAGAEEWKEVAILPLDREGRAQFDDLPVGPDLRLAFVRKFDRFESVTPFVLLEGQTSIAQFSMPPKRTPAEIEAQPLGEFHAVVLVQTDGRRPGIRLVE